MSSLPRGAHIPGRTPGPSCYDAGCQLPYCVTAKRHREKLTRVRRARGVNSFADVEETRDVLTRLSADGEASLPMIAQVAGVASNCLERISRREVPCVRAFTLRRLRGVQIEQLLALPPVGEIDATRTRYRLRAAVALGWSIDARCGNGHFHPHENLYSLAGRIGHPTVLHNLADERLTHVRVATARAIAAVVEQRIGVTGWGPCPETSVAARKAGWRVPAWYDPGWQIPPGGEDEPAFVGLDTETVAERRARLVAEIGQLAASGLPDTLIGTRIGMTAGGVQKIRSRNGIPAGLTRTA